MATSTSQPVSLPTPRQLLTSVLRSLFQTVDLPISSVDNDTSSHSTTTADLKEEEESKQEHDEKSTNPVKSLSAEKRALLMTLHVLIPQPVLLQALDLLDRRLVSKVIWYHDEAIPPPGDLPNDGSNLLSNQRGEEQVNIPNQAHFQRPSPITTSNTNLKPTRVLYQVRSSTSSTSSTSKSRYKDPSTYGSHQIRKYNINLEAWNCNCAAFAFSAFPYSSSSNGTETWRDIFPSEDDEDQSEDEDGDLDIFHPTKATAVNKDDTDRKRSKMLYRAPRARGEAWEYGGLSTDGLGSKEEEEGKDSVPICKHLLAVLLGEKWDIMRSSVEVRIVYGDSGRDEIAGVAVD